MIGAKTPGHWKIRGPGRGNVRLSENPALQGE